MLNLTFGVLGGIWGMMHLWATMVEWLDSNNKIQGKDALIGCMDDIVLTIQGQENNYLPSLYGA